MPPTLNDSDPRKSLIGGDASIHASLLHLFIEHSSDAVAMFDRNMRYLAVSRRWIEDYQLEHDEIIGRSHYEIFPEIPDRWKEMHRRGLAGEAINHPNDTFVRQDGDIDRLSWQIHPWRNNDGSVGGIVIFTQIITEQAVFQEELSKTETYLRTMNDNLPDAVFTVKMPERVIEYVNHTITDLFGYAKDEVIGQTTRLFYPTEEDYLAFGAQIRDALEQGLGSVRAERELITKDGKRFWASIATAFIYTNDVLTQVVSIVTDISVQKAVEQTELENERLRIALEKEKELADLRTQFITTISHELRTPLTSILVSTTMLEQYADSLSEEKRQSHFDLIRRQLDYLENTLRQVSLGMRAERGYLVPHRKPIDPEDLYNNAKAVAQSLMTESHELQLTCDRQHNSMLDLDEELLNRVLVNLLSNAVKYSPEGGPIGLDMTCTPERLTIVVEDEGMGISPEDKGRLFNPYFRGGNVGAIRGTGLGLAITKEIVDLLGGTITCESTLHQGARFTVVLPLTE